MIIDKLHGSLARREAKIAHQRDQIRGFEAKVADLRARLFEAHREVDDLRTRLRAAWRLLDTSLVWYAAERSFDQRVELFVAELDKAARDYGAVSSRGTLGDVDVRLPVEQIAMLATDYGVCAQPLTQGLTDEGCRGFWLFDLDGAWWELTAGRRTQGRVHFQRPYVIVELPGIWRRDSAYLLYQQRGVLGLS